MHEAVTATLGAWESFYVIVGSSAAALTGLQFVVIALIAEADDRPSPGSIHAFGTPTIVHFCAVLFVSAALSAPWPSLWNAALVLAATGVLGIGYVMIVIRRTIRQTGYRPVLSDWIWYMSLPMAAYAILLVGAVLTPRHLTAGPFLIAGTSLLLLFIGIHNAWDTVTYIAVEGPGATKPAAGGAKRGPQRRV